MISLTFHGAAQTVTGSKYLLEIDGEKVLIDCGVFQGPKELRLRNWEPAPFDAKDLKWLVLTHAHTDHIGFIPRLYKWGFRGKVLCSAPTRKLAEILLYDAAHLHEEDARFLNKKKATKHSPALPLFTTEEVKAVLKHFHAVRRGDDYKLSDAISFEYQDAGHILGARSIIVNLRDGQRDVRLLFSGDVGRFDVPLISAPHRAVDCEYLIIESTYGDRLHPDTDPLEALADLVHRIVDSGGVLLIPAFAVGRSQQLVHMLRRLEMDGRIPTLPIHVDSPMAIDATEIFCEFPDQHRVDLSGGNGSACLLYGDNITYHRSKESSQAINPLPGPRIIISSSGMLTGGRILHHLIHRMGDPRNIIALAGYQAHGTRGRDLVEGKQFLRFHGRQHEVKAEVVSLTGLSGHADYSELMQWASGISVPPQRSFITHGEPEPAEAMGNRLKTERGFSVHLPTLGEQVEL